MVSDERNLTYRYDETLGWFPIENSTKMYRGLRRSISVEHNKRGFRDSEHVIGNKPRIIFLGDSFVWGYDVEKPERFTEKLRAKLPAWSIYNLGVSGYGTDQEYLLLKQQYDFYRPNIVFLIFCTVNDNADNSSNNRYGGYFKPYFVSGGTNLELKGVPVTKSMNYFFVKHDIWAQMYLFRLVARIYFKYVDPPILKLQDPTHAIIASMHEFVKSKGAQFIIGLTGQQPELEQFLRERKIAYVDLSNPYRYPHRHWTPEGNTWVSEKIYHFLRNGDYLKMETTPEE